MDAEDIDLKKRKFLTIATSAVGLCGVAAVAVPFVSSMMPSADVESAGEPLRVKIGDLTPGQQRTVMWRGKPVWIVRRTPEELATLANVEEELRDPESTVDQQPDYARNRHRSIKPEFLVLIGVCTHLGCVPTYRPDPKSIAPDWEGGFYCSCHGSKYDMAGRVYKNVPAPINMQVPHYAYINDDEILIGVDEVPKTA